MCVRNFEKVVYNGKIIVFLFKNFKREIFIIIVNISI